MKKPAFRMSENTYVKTGNEVEAKCVNVHCIACGSLGFNVGFVMFVPIVVKCHSCKGKGTIRKFIGSEK